MYFYNFDQCLKFMYILGTYPDRNGSKIQIALFIIHNIITGCLVTLLVYWLVDKEKVVMMDIITTSNMVFYFVHGTLTLHTLFFKRFDILALLNQIKEHFWNVEVGQQKYLRHISLLKWKYIIYSRLQLFDVLVFLYAESLKELRLDTDTFPVNLYFPKGVPLVCIVILHCGSTLTLLVSAIVIDVLIFTIASLTEIQFLILNQELKNVFSISNPTENDAVFSRRIRKCNDHLTFLFSFRNMVNEIFSTSLFIYMGIIIISLCMNMYVISTEQSIKEAVRAFCHGMGLFFQLMLCYCYPVQKMVNAAEKTADCIYLSEWSNNSKHFKDVALLLAKAQQKLYISAGGLIDIDLQSGLAALKTTISYWGFLRTVGASE